MGLLIAFFYCQKPLYVLYFQSCTQYWLVYVLPCLTVQALHVTSQIYIHVTFDSDNELSFPCTTYRVLLLVEANCSLPRMKRALCVT